MCYIYERKGQLWQIKSVFWWPWVAVGPRADLLRGDCLAGDMCWAAVAFVKERPEKVPLKSFAAFAPPFWALLYRINATAMATAAAQATTRMMVRHMFEIPRSRVRDLTPVQMCQLRAAAVTMSAAV